MLPAIKNPQPCIFGPFGLFLTTFIFFDFPKNENFGKSHCNYIGKNKASRIPTFGFWPKIEKMKIVKKIPNGLKMQGWGFLMAESMFFEGKMTLRSVLPTKRQNQIYCDRRESITITTSRCCPAGRPAGRNAKNPERSFDFAVLGTKRIGIHFFLQDTFSQPSKTWTLHFWPIRALFGDFHFFRFSKK